MIAMRRMLSTHSLMNPRRLCVLLVLLLPGACTGHIPRPGSMMHQPIETAGYFAMPDGTRLPYRQWLPDSGGLPGSGGLADPEGLPASRPRVVVLALHGMNDSRDAWEYSAPAFAAAGMAVFSPDQRGFGASPTRGRWPGTLGLVDDADVMVRLLRTRYPHTRLIVMSESMGAAAAMVLATQPDPPPVDGYVLIAPAVWGRSEMNLLMRASLWLADKTVPGMTLTGGGLIKVTASSNRQALMRLSNDPLTIHETRVDAIKGLVDLMGQAAAAAGHFHAPALFLYGGHDELVPPRATAAIWHALPAGPTLAFYPNGYHLMLRDKDRAAPIGDILAWIRDPHAPLPSGADAAASAWLAKRDASP